MTSPAKPQAVSEQRLRALIEAYGANLAQFPEPERAGAQALLSSSEAARALWQEAKQFDALLAEEPRERAPSAALLAALGEIPARHPQQASVVYLLPRRSRAWLVLAAAAALLLGVFTGTQGERESIEEPRAQLAAQGDEGDDEADLAALSEFGALALGSELLTDLDQVEGAEE